jgi:hypothetical protein
MKKICLLLIAMIAFTTVNAQDTINKVARSAKHIEAAPDTIKHWQLSGFASLNVNQAYFVNWAAGGESSIGLAGFVNFQANYRKAKHSWTNNLDLAYGFNYLAPGSSEMQFRKTDDRIEYTTSYGYGISKHWDFTLLANFRSQFTSGYNYPNDSTVISKFMAPGYLIVGAGFTWIPAPYFRIFLSPASGRFTFVLDQQLSDSGAFGVERGKKILGQFGPYIRANLTKDFGKSVNITSTLDLFTNYLENFGNIDVNWNLLMTFKVNKWFSTSIIAQLIYDNKVMITDLEGKTGPRTQFKENIGIGISYKIL